MNSLSPRLQAFWLLLVCVVLGTAMLFLFDDSCQVDGGLHFLFARWAWTHHELFIGVWARPLFTFFYSFPAFINFRAARALTVVICLAIGWQTWRLAEEFKLPRAPLSIALLFLQPSFFLFCADTMTEPIFALVYVIALRLHHRGKMIAGMIVASLMILARPEGFFLGALWACWVLKQAFVALRSNGDKQYQFSTVRRAFHLKVLLQPSFLVIGFCIWWLVALCLTGDPLFIKHNWPSNWPMTGTVYGAHGLAAYPSRLPEMVGLFLLPVFVYGLIWLLRRRQLATLTSSFLLLFVVHTILRAYGMMGSAGYPRYLVTISPAMALITLAGWNAMAQWFAHVSRPVRIACATIILAISAWCNFVYADGAEWSRDARALNALHQRYQMRLNQPPVNRLVWSQPYASILFDRDPWENSALGQNRKANLQTLREMPAGTLAIWDEQVGPKEFSVRAEDFQAAGFVLLDSQSFRLKGYILDRAWFGFGGARQQTIYLFYKFDGLKPLP